jgi:hypothetical protein
MPTPRGLIPDPPGCQLGFSHRHPRAEGPGSLAEHTLVDEDGPRHAAAHFVAPTFLLAIDAGDPVDGAPSDVDELLADRAHPI